MIEKVQMVERLISKIGSLKELYNLRNVHLRSKYMENERKVSLLEKQIKKEDQRLLLGTQTKNNNHRKISNNKIKTYSIFSSISRVRFGNKPKSKSFDVKVLRKTQEKNYKKVGLKDFFNKKKEIEARIYKKALAIKTLKDLEQNMLDQALQYKTNTQAY